MGRCAVPVDFPKPQIHSLHELATQLLDKRKPGTDLTALARDMLAGFFDICARAGLDAVSTALERDDESQVTAIAAELAKIDLDGGGPRQAKPRQVADCVVAALDLAIVDESDRTIELGGELRTAVTAAIAGVVDVEMVPAALREAIVGEARTHTSEAHQASFTKIAAQLDDRGMQLVKQPKVPIDAMQAVQRTLFDARTAVITRITNQAIDRAKALIAAADATAAARIDEPITLRATPREVVALRICDPRLSKTPKFVTPAIVDGLGELARIKWRAAEVAALPYGASKTFAVGDLIEHPKFGRGKVVTVAAQRIDVEFPDGKHTLVHAKS
jgi:hypothetical protein